MFNRVSVKKISAMLSLMLIIAIMVPVLAFAASTVGFSSLTYKNGTVSGTVYTDVYDEGVNDAVYVNVNYSNVLLTTATATYNTYFDGLYHYYNFSTSVSNMYNSLDVNAVVYDEGVNVATSVYQPVKNTTPDNNRGGGGGGGGAAPIGTDGTISVGSDGSVDANSLANALKSGNVTLKLSGDSASIPASALTDADGKTITVINDNGSYILPISVLDLEELAEALGVDVKDLKIKVSISKVTGATADAVKAAATAVGGTQLADAVDFTVVAVGKDGKTVTVDFGNTYVSRTLNVSKAVDSTKTTGVLYNETTQKVSFVPATFSTTDGKTEATLKRNGNSIYTVIELNKSFADVASHWSKADVELLANKLVVDGATETAFQPERNITRAEFAALVVRSLGLTPATTSASFTDVKSDAWYASTVATATYAGIINGYEDNTFRPDAQITREELAAMVIRAVNFADVSTSVTDVDSVLSKFKDSNEIVWAQKEIAAAINAGIINGLTDTTIGSSEQATRAQAATMLKRFLSLANFID
ncbi:MAG: S-layer protein [Paenibacillus sp.]|nr:S-layer protein [Paenibacillus sp.]